MRPSFNLRVTLCAATALALAGCSTAEKQIQSSGAMGPSDATFVDTAYSIAQLDQQAGSLAKTRASDPRVIDLASKMSDEASVLYPELRAALKVEGKPAPTQLPPEVAGEVQQLSALKGPAFDKQFIADELAAHQRAAQILQAEATNSKDGALQAQAQQELPAVQLNLASLQGLAHPTSGS
jgi:putative membrane protein